METAIAAVNAGADRYVIKDHDLVEQLRRAVRQVDETLSLKNEAGYLRRELRRLTGLDNIIGQSPKMRAIFDLILTVAPQKSRVLITGESGTGKELVARAIHENSRRGRGTLHHRRLRRVSGNAAGVRTVRLHERRVYRGNENRARTISGRAWRNALLDEIGNMSQAMQVKLYRVLQEGKVRPIGCNEETEVDVRVIAATNRDLEKAIAEGEFREDLFYRLSVIPIHLPPLRERREDIPLLARSFLERFRKDHGKDGRRREPEAMGLWKPTSGPETSGNWKTRWSVRSRSKPGRQYPPPCSPKKSGTRGTAYIRKTWASKMSPLKFRKPASTSKSTFRSLRRPIL